MRTKRFLVRVRRFVGNHETGVVRFLTFLLFTLIGTLSLLIIGVCCTPDNSNDKVDVTKANFNTILPHDTIRFSTAEEEYQHLMFANEYKRQLLDAYSEATEILEDIVYDDFNCNDSITIEDIDDVLQEKGYYQVIQKVDSLLDNCTQYEK